MVTSLSFIIYKGLTVTHDIAQWKGLLLTEVSVTFKKQITKVQIDTHNEAVFESKELFLQN